MHRAGDTAITSRARLRSRCAVQPCEAAAALAALDERRRPFRLLDYERSLARAWVAAGQGAVSEAITVVVVGGREGFS